jgi:hypothetical protein
MLRGAEEETVFDCGMEELRSSVLMAGTTRSTLVHQSRLGVKQFVPSSTGRAMAVPFRPFVSPILFFHALV